MSFAIFIVGTGRSGTHFTCRSIQGFKNTFDPHFGNENRKILRRIAEPAIKHEKYPISVIRYYKIIRNKLDRNQIFIDQHHPNLFFFNELQYIFDTTIFLYIERNVVQVVSSMLNHDGVLSWYECARSDALFSKKIPFPNQFLGLNNSNQCDELPLHKLCAYRVVAHKKKIIELMSQYSQCRILNYDQLVKSQELEFNRIFNSQEISVLGEFSEIEKSKSDSLTKYKCTLNQRQIDDINEIYELEMGTICIDG